MRFLRATAGLALGTTLLVGAAAFGVPWTRQTAPPAKPHVAINPACVHGAGATARQTLGIEAKQRKDIPIRNIVVVMQENRSFDHYYGAWAATQTGIDGIPAEFTNPDENGQRVSPHHLATTCVKSDPPHQWDAMHAQWNGGRMDGFVTTAAGPPGGGRYTLGHYDERDLPFYHWLARTFSISDRHFSSALAGTWHNRQFLYTGTSRRIGKRGELTGVPTVFDALDAAGVGWAVYTDGQPRQDCIGWQRGHRGLKRYDDFLQALKSETLPPVVFVDPAYEADEHPPNDVQSGEAWFRKLYLAATKSALWPGLALLLTYDESGGFFDHVPPPAACPPVPSQPELNQLGVRIPLTLISPWARPGAVSHEVSEHASVLRFIEVVHDLPALSARDANASSLLAMFDFSAPHLLTPEAPPESGRGGCPTLVATSPAP